DRNGADRTARDLAHMISLSRKEIPGPSWRPPIIPTIATTGSGLPDLVAALTTHHDWLATHGELDTRRTHRARNEIEAIALASLHPRPHADLTHLARQVIAGTLDPYTAAEQWLS